MASVKADSQYLITGKVVDILLDAVAGALGYADPFGRGEIALGVVQQEGGVPD